jgi:hypothetical protein
MFGVSSALGKIAAGGAIGQVAGSLTKGVGPTIGGAMKHGAAALNQMAHKPGQQAKHPGGGFGGGLTGATGLAGVGGLGAGSALGQLMAGDTHKAAYMAVLAAALEKAHDSHFFNMETQMNDLWVKLSNLKTAGVHLDGMHAAIAAHEGQSKELKALMSGLGGTIKQFMQKIK